MKKYTDKATVDQLVKHLLDGKHPFEIRELMGQDSDGKEIATKDLIRNTRRAIIKRGERDEAFFNAVAAKGHRPPAEAVIDLKGKRYGDRTVIEYLGDKKWRMECKCGEEFVTDGADIRRSAERTQSAPYLCDHIETERFWSKVDKSPTDPVLKQKECWVWTAFKTPDGYGRFKTSDGKVVLAHRYSWMERFGEIPEGKELDHTCNIRACVRPGHLNPSTHAENIARIGRRLKP